VSSSSAPLAHHFDTVAQQRESVSLGMWLFLVTEILFFGGLFVCYLVYRSQYPEAFIAGSHHLDITLGALNTGVLIASSLTMALAVHAGQLGQGKRIIAFLLLTMVLGSVFLGVKGIEYHHKFEEHLFPGPAFHLEAHDAGVEATHVRLFFSLYFCMTALHATHMVVGIGILAWLVVMAARGRFGPGNVNALETTGLYWHFVDIVWIYLFPLLYLIGRH